MSKIKLAWFAWCATSLVLLAYSLAGLAVSSPTIEKLELIPGRTLDLNLFRLAHDPLEVELLFKANGCERRPELLGLHPEVRMLVSSPGARSEESHTLPLSGYCNDINVREMTIAGAGLHPGITRVRLEVTKVEQPLVGEVVKVGIAPPLGLELARRSYLWLWPWLFWPLFALVQVIWLVGLVFRFFTARAKPKAQA